MLTMRMLAVGALATATFFGALAGCAADDAMTSSGASDRPIEATSLLGEALRRPAMSEDARRAREAQLEAAASDLRREPDSEMAAIWHGRQLAYLGRYNDAVDAFTDGLAVHPRSYKLLRHRGHRYITLRRFDDAIADFQRADALMGSRPDEVEPDGQPNAAGIPRSSTRTNILYHLGLAHYLQGDFDAARETFSRCLAAGRNDDNVVSSSYWLVLSQRRSGRRAESVRTLAAISPSMDVIENHAYHRLLLMFKGDLTASEIMPEDAGDGVQDATVAYGVAAWRLINGERADAQRRFKAIVDAGSWPAFGHIAAEAELARMR